MWDLSGVEAKINVKLVRNIAFTLLSVQSPQSVGYGGFSPSVGSQLASIAIQRVCVSVFCPDTSMADQPAETSS